jgi:hypothetical protein
MQSKHLAVPEAAGLVSTVIAVACPVQARSPAAAG